MLLAMALTAQDRHRPPLRGHGRGQHHHQPGRAAAAPPSRAEPCSFARRRLPLSRTPPDKPILKDIAWTSAPARPWRWSASPAAARARCCSWSPGSTRSPPAPSPSTAWTCATSASRTCAPRRRRLRGHHPVLQLRPGQRAARRASRTRRRMTRDEALDEALDVAQAHFAYSLPEGVDTLIGEEGLSLSGGQRQRIALARAIAARRPCWSSTTRSRRWTCNTEELVERRLREVLADTTTLIVAHRPSTVALADRVALLEDGRIAAVGTHAELLAQEQPLPLRHRQPGPGAAGPGLELSRPRGPERGDFPMSTRHLRHRQRGQRAPVQDREQGRPAPLPGPAGLPDPPRPRPVLADHRRRRAVPGRPRGRARR